MYVNIILYSMACIFFNLRSLTLGLCLFTVYLQGMRSVCCFFFLLTLLHMCVFSYAVKLLTVEHTQASSDCINSDIGMYTHSMKNDIATVN